MDWQIFLRKGKFVAFAVLFVITAGAPGLIAAGCGGEPKADSKKASNLSGVEETIPVYTISDPTGDWGYPSPYTHYRRGPGYIRMSLIFDTLVWKDEKGQIPALAEKWHYNPEENSFSFDLNKNVKWHDGQKFTAKDAAFTFEYVKKHPYNMIDCSQVSKVEVIDEYRVKIYLSEKYAPFLNNIAGALPILPEHIWKDVTNPEEFIEPEAIVGTGPYKLLDYSKEHGTYLYKANRDYYLGCPPVQELKFVKVSNEMAAPAMERGEVNFAQIPPEMQDQLAGSGFEVIKTRYDWALKLMINHRKDPLSAREFRHALAFAIDREALVKNSKRGYALAGSPGLLSPDSQWYNQDVEQYSYDPEKAAALLNTLGYHRENGFFTQNGKELALEMLITPEYERDGQFIKQQLEKTGIRVNLKSMEPKTLDAMVSDWKFDLALSGNGSIGGDAEILNKVILDPTFISARYDANQELNDLLTEQLTVLDPGEREVRVRRSQALFARDLPFLTLYYPDWYYAHDGKVKFFNTPKGISYGIPLLLNKAAFTDIRG